MTHFARYAFLVPALFAAITTFIWYRVPGLSADGHVYLQVARNILHARELGWQALWIPPLHSILIAMAGSLPFVPNLLVATGIVTPIMEVLLAVAVYFLAVQIFNRPIAVAAAIVTSSFPMLIGFGRTTEPEITFTAILITSLALLMAAVKRESFPLACLSGVFFALTYLARSEGFLLMVMTLAVLCATEGFRLRLLPLHRLCAVVLITFFIVASPYLLFLKNHYGAFVISPKSSYVLSWMKSRVYHDNDKGEIGNEEIWGLAPDGKLGWQHPSGAGDLVRYLMSHPAKSLRVYLHNFSLQIPGRIPNPSGGMHYPQTFPVYLVILSVVAAFARWGDHSFRAKAVIFAPLLILLILPIFTEGWCKYLAPYSPLIFIAACAGLFRTVEWLSAHLKNRFIRYSTTISMILIITLAVYYQSLFAEKPAPQSVVNQERGNAVDEAREAALMARRIFGPNRNYMVTWNKMIYYLDGFWTADPITDHYNTSLAYARQNGVEFIVKEYFNEHPSDEAIAQTPQGIRVGAVYRSPRFNYTAVFFEVVR